MNFLDWTHKQITQTHLFSAVTETRHIFSTKLTPRSRIAKRFGQCNEKMGQRIGSPGKLNLKAPSPQDTGCTKLHLITDSSNSEGALRHQITFYPATDWASHQPFLKML